jgi:predicted nucleic acid-binding Zn ribbon protein
MKQCEYCGTEFEPAKPWATFCSERCRLRAFRQRKREAKPTFELEQALLAAVRHLRAGDTKEAIATVTAALSKLEPPPFFEMQRIATKATPDKQRKVTDEPAGAVLKRKATHKRTTRQRKATDGAGAAALKRKATKDHATLLERYERALAAGVKPIEVARAIGLPDSIMLGRWRRGGKLPTARAQALARWLNDSDHN